MVQSNQGGFKLGRYGGAMFRNLISGVRDLPRRSWPNQLQNKNWRPPARNFGSCRRPIRLLAEKGLYFDTKWTILNKSRLHSTWQMIDRWWSYFLYEKVDKSFMFCSQMDQLAHQIRFQWKYRESNSQRDTFWSRLRFFMLISTMGACIQSCCYKYNRSFLPIM